MGCRDGRDSGGNVCGREGRRRHCDYRIPYAPRSRAVLSMNSTSASRERARDTERAGQEKEQLERKARSTARRAQAPTRTQRGTRRQHGLEHGLPRLRWGSNVDPVPDWAPGVGAGPTACDAYRHCWPRLLNRRKGRAQRRDKRPVSVRRVVVGGREVHPCDKVCCAAALTKDQGRALPTHRPGRAPVASAHVRGPRRIRRDAPFRNVRGITGGKGDGTTGAVIRPPLAIGTALRVEQHVHTAC